MILLPTTPTAAALLPLVVLVRLVSALPEAPTRPTSSAEHPSFTPSGSDAASVTPFVTAGAFPELRLRRDVEPTLVQLGGFSYLGCYEDGSEPLSVTSLFDTGMTPELCRNVCSLADCGVFGLHNSNRCFCGKALEPFAVPAAAASECDQTCGGDERDLCGGQKRLNVYSATVALADLPKGTAANGGDGEGGGDGSGDGGSNNGSGDGGTSNNNDGSSDGSGSGGQSGSKDGSGDVTISVGAIAGIAIGSAAVVGLIGGIIACVCILKKRKKHEAVPASAYQAPPMASMTQSPQQHQQHQQQQQHERPPMQYNNSGSNSNMSPPQYGFGKPAGMDPSFSTVSPVSDPTNRSTSPMAPAMGATPPPPHQQGTGGQGHGAHEMSAPMSYEMPGSGYQR